MPSTHVRRVGDVLAAVGGAQHVAANLLDALVRGPARHDQLGAVEEGAELELRHRVPLHLQRAGRLILPGLAHVGSKRRPARPGLAYLIGEVLEGHVRKQGGRDLPVEVLELQGGVGRLVNSAGEALVG